MTLVEFNDILEYGEKKSTSVPVITQNDLELFQKTINMSIRVSNTYDNTDDANSFFALYPDVKKIVGSAICVECFYACKLGYFMHAIPSKLVYIVNKMLKENDRVYINKAINTAVQLLKPYVYCSFDYAGESYTVKDVIENLAGHSIKLITSSLHKVKVNDDWEVYIPDVDKIALLPDGIGGPISLEDCESLTFDKEKGIMLGDIPIRTIGNRIGLTRDDFDLRDCL